MARGKSTFATWFCSACNKGNYITTYNKKNTQEIMKEKFKHCGGKCRKHTKHLRKDTKKGN